MKPGERVASPRAMIRASLGTGRLLPAAVIRLPWTRTTPLGKSVFVFPSKSRAALSAMVAAGESAANEIVRLVRALSAQRRKARFMEAGIETAALDCKRRLSYRL